MSSTIIFEDKQTQYTEFIVDTKADLNNLKEATVHDIALCLEDKKVYARKANEWKEM